MALIECGECGNKVSTEAESCPHCGNPIKKVPVKSQPIEPRPIQYENKTVRVSCWGLGASNAIVEKLHDELAAGWEIVSTVEDHWRGGLLRHVYTVVLRRARKR